MMRRKKPIPPGALALAKMIRALMIGPHGLRELCEITGLKKDTVGTYVAALRKEGVTYRAAFGADEGGRRQVEEFALGLDKRDVDRVPRKKRVAEYMRNYRAKLKQRQLQAALAGQPLRVYNSADRIEQ
jgi:DNA-binding IclR family transcriptional regulator